MASRLAVLACLVACGGGGSARDGGAGPEGRPVGNDTEVVAFAGEHVYFAGDDNRRTVELEVEFPDAEPVYQSVLLSIALRCPAGGCDWWDRVGWISLMDGERELELARFVTPYRVEASFTIDVTDLVERLRGRQTLRLFIDTWVGPGHDQGAGWLVDASFSYIGGVANPYPYEVIPVWEPAPLVYGDPNQPTAREATVTVPDGATEVAFRGIITGHGQGSAENCAEFCARDHFLEINGARRTRTVWRDDCVQTAVPDQEGTWTLDRAGWCPGATVRYWFDLVTADAAPGEVTIGYDVEPYENTCRPDAPTCTGCLTSGCDYDGGSHTEPQFYLSGMLVLYQ